MKTILKSLAVLVALIVGLFAALALYVGTLNADKYRPQIMQTLSEKTGRKVSLNGKIGFSLGLDGIHVEIHDAAIGNPAWASRPNMAGMGTFEVGVGLLPLLAHKIDITKLSIENADILLETNTVGQHNWDMGVATKTPAAAAPAPETKSAATTTPALSVGKITITNSQLGMRGADGKISVYAVENLTLGMQGAGAVLNFKGSADKTPVTLSLKTGITDLLSKAAFPFDADVTYGAINLTAQGKADIANSRADIAAYQVKAGSTALTGSASAAWGGSKPVIQGKMESAHLNPADFKATTPQSDANGNSVAPAQTNASSSGDGRMFSDAPLPLDGLRAANASLQVAIGEVPLGKSLLKNVSATLTLANGDLSLSPVRATVGDKPIDLQLKLDASQAPAHLTVGVIGDGVDLGELQKLGDMTPFMTGKAGANIQLAGQGNSAHAIAASLGGVIVITAEHGEIQGGALSGISSTLATVLAPKGQDSAINCLAVRFIAKNGVLADNGMLIDSAASTMAGKGNVNLAAETVDLNLRAKTKLIDIGGVVPGVQVGGTLKDPSYSVDAVGVVKNVVGNLVNGKIDLAANSGVPDIQNAPAGQNACVYTLDHPKTESSSGVLPADAVGKASQKIQNLGNSLVKGLFGQ